MTVFTLHVHLCLRRTDGTISTQAMTFHKNTADSSPNAVKAAMTTRLMLAPENVTPPGRIMSDSYVR